MVYVFSGFIESQSQPTPDYVGGGITRKKGCSANSPFFGILAPLHRSVSVSEGVWGMGSAAERIQLMQIQLVQKINIGVSYVISIKSDDRIDLLQIIQSTTRYHLDPFGRIRDCWRHSSQHISRNGRPIDTPILELIQPTAEAAPAFPLGCSVADIMTIGSLK